VLKNVTAARHFQTVSRLQCLHALPSQMFGCGLFRIEVLADLICDLSEINETDVGWLQQNVQHVC